MTIAGKTGVPPFAPSAVFPWGSDAVGRDIQALVLAGAKQTLTLALLGMLARVAVGTVLGVLAGWWRGGQRMNSQLAGPGWSAARWRCGPLSRSRCLP